MDTLSPVDFILSYLALGISNRIHFLWSDRVVILRAKVRGDFSTQVFEAASAGDGRE